MVANASSATERAKALLAPLNLKAPTCCKFSHFIKTLLPALSSIIGELTTGVLFTIPSSLSAALQISENPIAYTIPPPPPRESNSSFLRRVEALRPRGNDMSDVAEPEWRLLAGISSLLILDALFLGIAPMGPWDDQSFSRGVIGLIGASIGYVAWYRATFQRNAHLQRLQRATINTTMYMATGDLIQRTGLTTH